MSHFVDDQGQFTLGFLLFRLSIHKSAPPKLAVGRSRAYLVVGYTRNAHKNRKPHPLSCGVSPAIRTYRPLHKITGGWNLGPLYLPLVSSSTFLDRLHVPLHVPKPSLVFYCHLFLKFFPRSKQPLSNEMSDPRANFLVQLCAGGASTITSTQHFKEIDYLRHMYYPPSLPW